MIRFARICSKSPSRDGIMVLAFSAGLVGGTAIGLTLQSRPAPAAAEPTSNEPESAAAPRSGTAPAVASLPAEVLRVIDGDTFEARVHVWPGLDITTKVRLRGIDAPELRARCPAERTKAEAARDALVAMLAEGAVGVSGVSLDKYGGRVVADARTRSVANVSAELLEHGYARAYRGGHRDGWCDGR
jgi:endonuclease YncB( thermonuclease family)